MEVPVMMVLLGEELFVLAPQEAILQHHHFSAPVSKGEPATPATSHTGGGEEGPV